MQPDTYSTTSFNCGTSPHPVFLTDKSLILTRSSRVAERRNGRFITQLLIRFGRKGGSRTRKMQILSLPRMPVPSPFENCLTCPASMQIRLAPQTSSDSAEPRASQYLDNAAYTSSTCNDNRFSISDVIANPPYSLHHCLNKQSNPLCWKSLRLSPR